MSNRGSGFLGRPVSRGVLATLLTCLVALWSSAATATITQGDFSVFGNFSSRWSGRWGEGGAVGGTPATLPLTFSGFPANLGAAPSESGGSFDFNHWDLVQARQAADIRPDYHIVKNYNFLGRLDTLVLKDADVFAVYRPWYDAFPDLKHRGVAQTDRDWPNYTQRDRVQQFVRDDLREYYAQLNFTDNFSMRVGKQQVIWSEADALSGTEVTNPVDFRYHWTHFETPEDQRINLRMVKFNYILPDFLKTANNEFEFFVIPGDWEHTLFTVNTTDARSPYPVRVAPFEGLTSFNESGQPIRNQTLADIDPTPLLPSCTASSCGFFDLKSIILQKNLTNSLDNSEFGARYSTLLPVGNGLQTSLIYLYEARSPKLVWCATCPVPPGFKTPQAIESFLSITLPPGLAIAPPGTFIGASVFGGPTIFGPPKNPNVVVNGSIEAFLRNEIVRQHWLGLTGTYYDKDLTDIVYRYDVLYAPKTGVNKFNSGPVVFLNNFPRPQGPAQVGGSWKEETRWIFAGDRPTYIPWLSKQHTFLVFQNVVTWYPDRPDNANGIAGPDARGKLREVGDLTFLAANNWLINGQLTALNVVTWDWDDNVGFLNTNNSYRYSRNILFGLNAYWYIGRSGRFTDPFVFSRNQRINEVEVRFTYEI